MGALRFSVGGINEAAFRHPKLEAVRHYVREHIGEVNGPTLLEVAKLARLSPKYFSSFFKDHVGVAFSVWRSRTKIERAKELLVDAPWTPVGAIGARVGYPALTTFARAFKRHEGVTPRRYRKIASGVARWRPSAFSHASGGPADGVARLDQTIVEELVQVANMMHRLS